MNRPVTRCYWDFSSRAIALLVVAGGMLLIPSLGFAQIHDAQRGRYDRGDRYERRDHDRDDHRGRDYARGRDHGRDRDYGGLRVDIGIGGRHSGPVYQDHIDRVWVEPVYRTVVERVWVEPVYRTEIERVWVEPVYEIREVVVRKGRWQRIDHERVLIQPGGWQERPRQVLVCEGYFKTIERPELVMPGHWEERITRARVADRSGLNLRFGYRW